MSKSKTYASLGDFAIRDVVYVDGHSNPNKYDIVKYEDHEPLIAIDCDTGEKKVLTRSCFSIGTLTWDEKEGGFEFKSCGLRYLKHREDGLEDLILFFTNMETKKRKDE